MGATSENVIENITADVDKNLTWGSGDAGFGMPKENIIRRWLQLGRDPVVNAPIHRTKSEFKEHRQMIREDMLGTDISSSDPVHKEQSRNFWKRVIKDKALAKMRQDSLGSSDIGILSFTNHEQKVAGDPVDNELTRWEEDPNFSKCTKTCEVIFGTKPRNMKDFEMVLENASADQLFEFWNGARSQLENHSHNVLGLASLTYYEGMELKDYCQRIKPLNDIRKEFISLLLTDINRCGGWSIVAARLAEVYSSIYDIYRQRRTRLIDENKIKSWQTMDDDEKNEFCLSEREFMKTRILGGEFDPEGSFTCDAWRKEHECIHDILNRKIAGCSFTLLNFWEQYERINEMQREHMYSTHANKLKFAMCFKRIRNELNGNEDAIYDFLIESLKKSTFDFGNGILIPYMSDIWCKLNWPFYGATGYKQNTLNGNRSYLFHHGTPSQVKAIAMAYYSTRPLSEAIDYSSPYTFRQSHANILAEAGVQSMEDRDKASKSTEALCEWEEDLAAVVKSVKSRMGKVRRRHQENARTSFAHSTDAGGNISEIAIFATGTHDALKEWTPGNSATVSFDWNPQELSDTSTVPEGDVASAKYNKRSQGRIEISLWRRKTQNDLNEEYLCHANAQNICQKEIMKDISHYTVWFYTNVVNNPECFDAENKFLKDVDLQIDGLNNATDSHEVVDDSEHQHWIFAAMLDDNIELTGESAHSITLPFAASDFHGKYTPFPSGEYRIRVRGFRYEANPSRHPARCVQNFSKSFQLNDTISEEINAFVSKDSPVDDFFPSEELPALVQHLRAKNYDISVDTEFSLGQRITPKGKIGVEYIIDTLRSGEGWKNPCTNGVADDELAAESKLFMRFEELNPGASLDEWMSMRRAVFKKAFTGIESAWWIEDDLETEEIAMHNLNEPVWYAHDKVTGLSATGTHCITAGKPLVECEIEGSGVVTKLDFNEKRGNVALGEAVHSILGSLQNAHTRMNFLALGKISPLLEKIHLCIADREHGYNGFASWGGKYLRTIYFCYKSAQRNLKCKMSSLESMMRNKSIERWGSSEYRFRTEKPTQEYRLGPHEALTNQESAWPK